MRITIPRRTCDAPASRERPVANYPPPDPPKLQLHAVVVWKLDLRAESHRAAFLTFIDTTPVPLGVVRAHLHSSTPCNWVFPGVRINYSLENPVRRNWPLVREQLALENLCLRHRNRNTDNIKSKSERKGRNNHMKHERRSKHD